MNALPSRNRDLALLGLRLGLGVLFILAGWAKVSHVAGVVGLWQRLHLPLPYVFGPIHAVVEFAGGILLIAGLFARLFGFLLAVDMLGAHVSSEDSHPNFHPAGMVGVLDQPRARGAWRGLALLGCVF